MGAVNFSAVETYGLKSYDGCRFDGKSASSTGRAKYSTTGNDFVSNTTFMGNSAVMGGGMSVSGTMYMFNSDGGGPAISNGGVISKIAQMFISANGYHCLSYTFIDVNDVDAVCCTFRFLDS